MDVEAFSNVLLYKCVVSDKQDVSISLSDPTHLLPATQNYAPYTLEPAPRHYAPAISHTSEARLLIYPPPRLNVKYLSNPAPACTVETPPLWNGR